MKYELISKDVLDDALRYLLDAEQLLSEPKDKEFRVTAKEWIQMAYKKIQENRTQCNVKPEGENQHGRN